MTAAPKPKIARKLMERMMDKFDGSVFSVFR